MKSKYALMYRWGIRPWERYGTAAATTIAAVLDRETRERSDPPGRALDLGCGRGQFTPELARRGWEAVGVDLVPAAVEHARCHAAHGETYVVGDVTRLSARELGGTFDFFLDVGCLQGLDAMQREAEGSGVTALANPGATLLVLAFGCTWLRSVVGGVSPDEVTAAFPGWDVLSVEPAETAGLGWPMSRTSPRWYRLRVSDVP